MKIKKQTKLKRTKKGVEIIFENDMEQKIIGIFLFHADLKSKEAIISLNLFDNLVLNDEYSDKIKNFVLEFNTAFMQLADNKKGCPNSIHLRTNIFELYNLLPDFLVLNLTKKGIQVADLNNPMDWLFEDI